MKVLAALAVLAAAAYTAMAADTQTVEITGSGFSPGQAQVDVGGTVTWKNATGVTHTVTSDTGVFSSGNLAQNATFAFTFRAEGVFAYHCAIHPSMRGQVTVGSPDTKPGPPESPGGGDY